MHFFPRDQEEVHSRELWEDGTQTLLSLSLSTHTLDIYLWEDGTQILLSLSLSTHTLDIYSVFQKPVVCIYWGTESYLTESFYPSLKKKEMMVKVVHGILSLYRNDLIKSSANKIMVTTNQCQLFLAINLVFVQPSVFKQHSQSSVFYPEPHFRQYMSYFKKVNCVCF